MGEREHDREDLTEALNLVLKAFPSAVAVQLETSDQGRCGFLLRDVQIRDERGERSWISDYERTAELEDSVWPLVSSLGWDGLVGEDDHGWAVVEIAEKMAELRARA